MKQKKKKKIKWRTAKNLGKSLNRFVDVPRRCVSMEGRGLTFVDHYYSLLEERKDYHHEFRIPQPGGSI